MVTRERHDAVAFAPGHVTGIFAPDLAARDPRARGSIGAGIVLELGATARARFEPGPRHRIRVTDGTAHRLDISTDVARRLAPTRPGTLTVRIDHALPVGQGFGMSAAGATATAMAVSHLSGRSTAEAVEVAHLADLFGRGGLGGVAAILGGGWELRERAGVPPWGRIDHRPFTGTLFLGVHGGPIPSPTVLSEARAIMRLRKAANGLDRIRARPTQERFFEESERFTDAAGLAPPALRRTLGALRRRGAWAAQAMFGRSFFAAPRSPRFRAGVVEWLERSGLHALELRPARRGAHLLSAQPF